MNDAPRRGALHWFEADKRRPGIVVSPDTRNALAHDVILVPCSTNLRAMSWHVLLERGEGGLKSKSVAKCEQIVTVPKRHLSVRPLGRPLSPERMRQVERGILRAIGILV